MCCFVLIHATMYEQLNMLALFCNTTDASCEGERLSCSSSRTLSQAESCRSQGCYGGHSSHSSHNNHSNHSHIWCFWRWSRSGRGS